MKQSELRGAIQCVLQQGGDPAFLLLAMPVAEDEQMSRRDAVERAASIVDSALSKVDADRSSLGGMLIDAIADHQLGVVLSAAEFVGGREALRVEYALIDDGTVDAGRVICTGPRRDGIPRSLLGALDGSCWFDGVTGKACDLALAVSRALDVSTQTSGLKKTLFSPGTVGTA